MEENERMFGVYNKLLGRTNRRIKDRRWIWKAVERPLRLMRCGEVL